MRSLIVVIAIALFLPASGQETNRLEGLPKLNIQRSQTVIQTGAKETEVNRSGGMVRAAFIVPPDFLYRTVDPNADPFAVEHRDVERKPLAAQQVLERAGISFEREARAIYNPLHSILIVVQTETEMQKVRDYVGVLANAISGSNIVICAEIFELPIVTAVETVDSASRHFDHTPERNQILEFVRHGKARLVNSLTVISKSGNRSRVSDAEQILTFTGFVKEMAERKKPIADETETNFESQLRPRREKKHFGTIFAVDPVLGMDQRTLDLDLQLEHHTAPPISVTAKVEIPGTGEYKEVAAHEFFAHKVTAQITLISGHHVLVGNWRPTGDAKYEKHQLMHLAFVYAKVLPAREFGEIPANEVRFTD